MNLSMILIGVAYLVYAAFWVRFVMHGLVWWRAVRRSELQPVPSRRAWKACLFTAGDVVFFARLLMVNPALWIGEWLFHLTFLLVIMRHMRYFLNPVPSWVWWAQTPGVIAGYMLPLALLYILIMRLVFKKEKYASSANVFLLGLVLVISSIGAIMHAGLKPDLVDVKLFVFGIMTFSPVAAPGSLLFLAHFILVLVLIPLLPTHIFTAPLVMFEARRRDLALHGMMHEFGEQEYCNRGSRRCRDTQMNTD